MRGTAMQDQLMHRLVAMLGEGRVETYDGMPRVVIDLGYNDALEVDYWPEEAGPFQLAFRAWDRTGGLASEAELGQALSVGEIFKLTRAALARIRSEDEQSFVTPIQLRAAQYLQEV